MGEFLNQINEDKRKCTKNLIKDIRNIVIP